jgi:predicted nucleic acid-binding protein
LERRIDEILAKLKLDGWATATDDLEQILSSVTADGTYQALLQIGMGEEHLTDLMRTRALEYAQERAAQLIGEIRESTREFIRSDVATAIEEGWSTQKFASALSENYAFSDARAETIARTEIATADVQGNMIFYRGCGVVSGKEWLVGNNDSCDECEANEADDVIGLDEKFTSGDDAPPAHPNCTCDVLPVLTEEESDER